MNEQKNKLDYLQYWLFKAIVITVLPFIIGLISNTCGSYTSGKIFIFVLTILYVSYVIYIAYTERKQDINKQNTDKLKEDLDTKKLSVETYQIAIESMNSLMNVSQKEINDLSKQIISSNNLDLLSWNFDSIANYICKDIVKLLSKISKSGTDISVNIYVRDKKKNGRKTQDYIKMIAHWGGTNSIPSILYSDIILSKKKDWQYAKLFLDNNPKIVIYPTEEEIKKHFKYNESPNKYDGEYTQYIGIPISCSSGYILSSLEIISHHGTIIAETKEDILKIINDYIIVYRNYALLTHKIEKGLRSKRIENN